MTTYRFIGGPLHGELRALQEREGRLRVPIYEPLYRVYNIVEEPSSLGLREVVYERRPLGLGMAARVYVYVPQDMQESEFMRRVADLIEGVGEKPRR